MDAERLQRDGPGRGLLGEDELPEFVLEAARQGGSPGGPGEGSAAEEEAEEEDERGRRRRTRTASSYSEVSLALLECRTTDLS